MLHQRIVHSVAEDDLKAAQVFVQGAGHAGVPVV